MGTRLGQLLMPGDIIALNGDLGSGKTTFTKGIAAGLDVKDPEYVNSPSFIIVKEYNGRLRLYHLDLYRIEDISDMEYLRPQEYMTAEAVVVVEWAKRLGPLMPAELLQIDIDILGKHKRGFGFRPHGRRYETLVSRYIEQKV